MPTGRSNELGHRDPALPRPRTPRERPDFADPAGPQGPRTAGHRNRHRHRLPARRPHPATPARRPENPGRGRADLRRRTPGEELALPPREDNARARRHRHGPHGAHRHPRDVEPCRSAIAAGDHRTAAAHLRVPHRVHVPLHPHLRDPRRPTDHREDRPVQEAPARARTDPARTSLGAPNEGPGAPGPAGEAVLDDDRRRAHHRVPHRHPRRPEGCVSMLRRAAGRWARL